MIMVLRDVTVQHSVEPWIMFFLDIKKCGVVQLSGQMNTLGNTFNMVLNGKEIQNKYGGIFMFETFK